MSSLHHKDGASLTAALVVVALHMPDSQWVGSGRVALRYVSPMPGSRAGLLPPSPLRTARESFPSSSSSLANAPCGTRWCHVLLWHHLHHTRLEPPHRHRLESAPVSVATAVICFLSSR